MQVVQRNLDDHSKIGCREHMLGSYTHDDLHRCRTPLAGYLYIDDRGDSHNRGVIDPRYWNEETDGSPNPWIGRH